MIFKMTTRRLELKAELIRKDYKYRDLASKLQDRGFEVGEFFIARIVAGRFDPPLELKKTIAEILQRPTFEIFEKGGRVG